MVKSCTVFHGETRFARAPAEVWPILSDTNRRNEVVQGIEAFTVEAEPAPDGSVRRHARGRLGPLRVEREEGFGEWVENRYWRQVRHYTTGPLRSLSGEMRLVADNGGTRVQYHYEVSWDSLLGGLNCAARRSGACRQRDRGDGRGDDRRAR